MAEISDEVQRQREKLYSETLTALMDQFKNPVMELLCSLEPPCGMPSHMFALCAMQALTLLGASIASFKGLPDEALSHVFDTCREMALAPGSVFKTVQAERAKQGL